MEMFWRRDFRGVGGVVSLRLEAEVRELNGKLSL